MQPIAIIIRDMYNQLLMLTIIMINMYMNAMNNWSRMIWKLTNFN